MHQDVKRCLNNLFILIDHPARDKI